MNVIFSGTTSECVEHLAKATAHNHLEKRKMIASFVGVNDASVQRWFSGGMMPAGESLLRVRFYLEHLGYEVSELQSLNPTIRDAARLFAFGVTSISEMANLVGYQEGPNGNDGLIKVLRGARGVSKKRLSEFASFVEAFRDQLDEKKERTPKIQLNATITPAKIGGVSGKLGQPTVLRPIKPNEPLQSEHDAIISSLGDMVKAMLPLARAVSSDNYTPEERARVRELSGGNGVFNLANTLFRLCGERSRKIHS